MPSTTGNPAAEAIHSLAEALRSATVTSDAFSRAWYRARPDETTREAYDRGIRERVAAMVGRHPDSIVELGRA